MSAQKLVEMEHRQNLAPSLYRHNMMDGHVRLYMNFKHAIMIHVQVSRCHFDFNFRKNSETKTKMLLPFIVDCELSQWGEFDECTKPCGGGTQTKNRTITVLEIHIAPAIQ